MSKASFVGISHHTAKLRYLHTGTGNGATSSADWEIEEAVAKLREDFLTRWYPKNIPLPKLEEQIELKDILNHTMELAE